MREVGKARGFEDADPTAKLQQENSLKNAKSWEKNSQKPTYANGLEAFAFAFLSRRRYGLTRIVGGRRGGGGGRKERCLQREKARKTNYF